MNWKLTFFFALTLVVVVPLQASTTAPDDVEPAWDVKEYSAEDSEHYSHMYRIDRRGTCVVQVWRDKPGLLLSASTGELLETIRIYSPEDGGITMGRMTTRSVSRQDGKIEIAPVHRKIFGEQCLEHAKKLPPEVRREFYGFFGIR